MELWIRSQDRKMLINAKDIHIATDDVTIVSEAGYLHCLGTYKTKERALEVLDEIQNFMTIKHSYSGTYEEIDIRLKTDIASNMIKIYIMPEE